jgi:hypothetical protein
MNTSEWFVLGFRYDEIIEASQDARLAQACVTAWRSEGGASEPQVLWTPGEGEHIYHWYVSQATALLLDRHGISWRQFVVGACSRPPREARQALRVAVAP